MVRAGLAGIGTRAYSPSFLNLLSLFALSSYKCKYKNKSKHLKEKIGCLSERESHPVSCGLSEDKVTDRVQRPKAA